LELPPAQSISEAHLQDRRVAALKQQFERDNAPEPVARPSHRTAIFDSVPAPVTPSAAVSTGDLAKEIAGMSLDQARARMEGLMRAANGGGQNWRTRAAEQTVLTNLGY
jgi:hypothetical protein